MPKPATSSSFDPTADFNSIKSQLSHIDILLKKTVIPLNITEEVEGEVFKSVNTFLYAIMSKNIQILSVLLDSVIKSDKLLEEKTGKSVERNESAFIKLCILGSPLDLEQRYTYYHPVILKTVLDTAIETKDLSTVRFVVQKMGCAYVFPSIFIDLN